MLHGDHDIENGLAWQRKIVGLNNLLLRCVEFTALFLQSRYQGPHDEGPPEL
jgi:hypothetical protein